MKGNNEAVFFIILAILALGFLWEPIQSQRGNSTGQLLEQDAVSNTKDNKEASKTLSEIKKEAEQIQGDLEKLEEEKNRSPYYGKITISQVSNLNNKDPSKEYIRINSYLDKGEQVNITGWRFKSEITGNYAVIGKVSLLPYPSQFGIQSDIILTKGDRAIITKGYSPIGISFRTNKCTGFFEENRTFTPSLPMQCPRPIDEKLPKFSDVLDRQEECLDIIENIPICTTKGNSFIRDLPDTVSSACKNYITTKINYNTCVANHYSDIDFPGHDYRFYLNSFQKLWRDWNREEKIRLYDNNGLIVDTIEYN